MKKFQVYKVDICFEEYAMNYDLIGAESKEDLIKHLKEIYKDYLTKKQLMKFNDTEEDERFSRICPIEHVFTDTPYVILDGFGYIE